MSLALWTDDPCSGRGLGVLLCSFLCSPWLSPPLSLPWCTEYYASVHSHLSVLWSGQLLNLVFAVLVSGPGMSVTFLSMGRSRRALGRGLRGREAY